MIDIQRYTVSGVMTPVKPDAVTTTKWIQEQDHLKAIEAKDQYISHHNIVLDGQSEMIAKRDKTIEAQAKEIAELKKEVEGLQRSLSGLNDDKERRINQDWDNYQPSPRNMG